MQRSSPTKTREKGVLQWFSVLIAKFLMTGDQWVAFADSFRQAALGDLDHHPGLHDLPTARSATNATYAEPSAHTPPMTIAKMAFQ